MLEQLAVLNGWIDAKTARITELAAATTVSKRWQTIPGGGQQVAVAGETVATDMKSFHHGRHVAAWVGLAPRKCSSCGKERTRAVAGSQVRREGGEGGSER